MLLLSVASMALGADEIVTHRVTGLFSPDREAELRAAVSQIPDVKLVSVDFQHAEAVFSYDTAVVFKGAKPESIVERFDGLLRTATHQTMGIAPVDPTPKGKLALVEIPVAGLDCKACCLATYESIFKIEGVAAATASFKEGRVTALIDPAKTNREELEAALTKRGVTLVK